MVGRGYNSAEINLSDELNYKDFVLAKLNEFGHLKQSAIFKEDFASANALHNQMQSIRDIGNGVKDLLQKRDEASRSGNFLRMSGIEKSLD